MAGRNNSISSGSSSSSGGGAGGSHASIHNHKSAIKAIACTVCEKLNDAKLKRLGEHKYSSSGSTLLDPIMQKFWNWFVAHCIPRWWAPNAMTLVGLVFNIFTCSLLVYYSPDARQEIPAWVLVLAAIGLFVYQTLDACDGKQARRTGNSSSLGELFDHGCDAVSTIFVSLSVCLSVQLGSLTTWMVVLCAGATSLFYTAHWQTYVSGTLKFGKFDVTEAQFTIITIHLVSAIFGTSFWNTIDFLMPRLYYCLVPLLFGFLYQLHKYLSDILKGGIGKNGSTVAVFGVQLKVIPMAFTVLNECFIFSCDLKSILGGGCGKNGSTVAGTSILSPIIPILLVFSFTLIIYTKSTTNVFVDHVALYIITFGFVAAKITNKLVVAHMSKSEMSKIDTIFIGPLMLFFNQYFNFYFDEYLMLWLAFTYILIDFIYFSYSTCRQLADFLNIYILKINEPSDGSSSGGAGGGGGIGGGGPSVSTRAASNAGGGSQNEETHITEDEDSERLRETESLLGYPSPGSPVPHQQQQQQFAVSSDGLTEATMVDMGDEYEEEDEEGLTGKERMLRMMMNNNGGKMMTAITTTPIITTAATTITTTATNHGYEDI